MAENKLRNIKNYNMTTTKIKIILIISLFIGHCSAQQETQFTMKWNTYSLFNPATTALSNKHTATICRVGEEPKTICAIYNFKWDKLNSGIGLNYVNDQIGMETNNKYYFNYSYHQQLMKERILSFGISFGIERKSVDYSKFIPIEPSDPLHGASVSHDLFYNINLGIALKTSHFLYGLSVTQLNEYKSEILYYKNKRNIIATCIYTKNIGKNVTLKPNIFVKTDLTSTQYDINILMFYKKRLWAGLTYRKDDAIAIMAGVDIKGKFRLGYSYDFTKSKIGDYSKGSNEIVLSFMTPEI